MFAGSSTGSRSLWKPLRSEAILSFFMSDVTTVGLILSPSHLNTWVVSVGEIGDYAQAPGRHCSPSLASRQCGLPSLAHRAVQSKRPGLRSGGRPRGLLHHAEAPQPSS